MKIVALDIGDIWTGTALSDPMGIIAKPYKTTLSLDLRTFLDDLFQSEKIKTIIIGYPKTMGGKESEQTKKTVALVEQLRTYFPNVTFILWDERLSSKRADMLTHGKLSKEEKRASHSRAAAFILSSYLEYIHMHAQNKE